MVHVVSWRPLWINRVLRNKNPKWRGNLKKKTRCQSNSTKTRWKFNWAAFHRLVSARFHAPRHLHSSTRQSSRLLKPEVPEDSQNKISAKWITQQNDWHSKKYIHFYILYICFNADYAAIIFWHLEAIEFIITQYPVVVLVGDVKYSA